MSKLNIQILSNYLPFNIKCQLFFDNNGIMEFEREGVLIGIKSTDNKEHPLRFEVKTRPESKYSSELAYNYNEVKPFLRPISDADIKIRTEWSKFHRCETYDKDVINLFSFEKLGTDELLQDLDLIQLPYDSIQWLLSNHFDVFGLLDSGDAVLLA